jgi:hypothetical protein
MAAEESGDYDLPAIGKGSGLFCFSRLQADPPDHPDAAALDLPIASS